MNNTKVLIVEDEILIAEHIKDYLLNYGVEEIFMAHNKESAKSLMDEIKPNLVLLDLHLKSPLDGFELAKYIDSNLKLPYIFITANSDLLVIDEIMQTKASAYITKPVRALDLFAAIKLSLKSNKPSEEKYLHVKDGYSIQKIAINDILYIESEGNYLQIYSKQQKQLCRQSMDWIQTQLPEMQFMRIHRSYIVNLQLVNKANSKFVFIENFEIPISRTYLPKVYEYLKVK